MNTIKELSHSLSVIFSSQGATIFQKLQNSWVELIWGWGGRGSDQVPRASSSKRWRTKLAAWRRVSRWWLLFFYSNARNRPKPASELILVWVSTAHRWSISRFLLIFPSKRKHSRLTLQSSTSFAFLQWIPQLQQPLQEWKLLLFFSLWTTEPSVSMKMRQWALFRWG